MTMWPSNRYDVRYATEAHGSFGAAIAAPTTYWGTATRIRVTKADPNQLKYATVDDAAVLMRSHDQRGTIRTVKSGSKFSFSTYLTGKGGGASPHLRDLFTSAMGGVHTGPSGVTVSGETATPLIIPVSAHAGFSIGDVVMIGGEARVVTAIDSVATPKTITLHMELESAPADTTPIYCGDTFYIDPDAIGDPDHASYTSLCALFRGRGTDVYQMRGCKGGFKLSNLGPGNEPTVDWELLVSNWEIVADPGEVADATNDGPVVTKGSSLWYGEVAATDRTRMHVADVTVDPGLAYTPFPSPQADEAVMAFGCLSSAGKLSLKPYYGTAWNTAFEADTDYHVLYQIGTTATKTVAIFCPRVVLEATPTRGDARGVTVSELAFRMQEAASGSTDLALSKLLVALL